MESLDNITIVSFNSHENIKKVDIDIQKCFETAIVTIYARRKFFEKYLIAKKLELKSYQYYYIQPNGKLQMLKISIYLKPLVYFCPISRKVKNLHGIKN